jgi:hypothetical protein
MDKRYRSMTPSLLPEWLRWLWVGVYAVIVVVHLSHAIEVEGRQRTWHFGHVVMAVGMVSMLLPSRLKIVSDVAWEILFAVVAAAILAWLLRAWINRRTVNFLWALSLLDMLAMVYMFAFPGAAIAPVTYVLVIYFVGVMVGWMKGMFDDDGGRDRLLPLVIGPRSCSVSTFAGPLPGASSVSERTTLSAMAAGMAYMFIAMQAGL